MKYLATIIYYPAQSEFKQLALSVCQSVSLSSEIFLNQYSYRGIWGLANYREVSKI